MHNLVQGITASFEARIDGIMSLREEVRGHRHAMQVQLGELDRNHQAMALQLRNGLARGHAALTAQEAGRKAEVHTWLHEVDQAHQAMSHQLQADLARGRDSLTQAESRRKAEVHEWIGQVATEHNGARQEWRRLTRTLEFTALSERVFQHLANHPDGARLTDIEQEFGLGRLQAGRVVRHLMNEGKAEKRDLSYFAT
jgi:hypothetical protein